MIQYLPMLPGLLMFGLAGDFCAAWIGARAKSAKNGAQAVDE